MHKDVRRSKWRFKLFISFLILALLLILGVATGLLMQSGKLVGHRVPAQTQTGDTLNVSSHTNDTNNATNANDVTTNNATIEKLVQQVLVDEGTNGWDARYNGVLINWRRDDLSKVNCNASACDSRGNTTRHDGQDDLRYLENLYWYKARQPNDTSVDRYIEAILPHVKQSWGETNLDKGWVYYILLRLAQNSPEHAYWDHAAQHWAAQNYQSIDPALGIHHGSITASTDVNAATLQDAYRVDHDLEIGLALVDAGTRYQQPTWVKAGQREVETVIGQSFSSTYHLFNRIYVIADPTYGANKVVDHQAKMGEQGEELEALLRTGMYTNNQQYLDLASQMLDALQSQPIHDKANGGFFFKMYLGSDQSNAAGAVSEGSKETRQLHVLASVHLANGVMKNRWAGLEQELTTLAITPNKLFQAAPVPGFFYQQLPNFSVYPCKKCSPMVGENWVSAESNGIALEAIQTLLTPVVQK